MHWSKLRLFIATQLLVIVLLHRTGLGYHPLQHFFFSAYEHGLECFGTMRGSLATDADCHDDT